MHALFIGTGIGLIVMLAFCFALALNYFVPLWLFAGVGAATVFGFLFLVIITAK